mmetsp:Transcript_42339/g.120103  ORF Transcript_42339/g.120103 Transcript_42339/m.120103 type:complete len:91 (+) Transcript_42339:291-563(+)
MTSSSSASGQSGAISIADVDVVPRHGATLSDASLQLSECVIRRTITDPQQVTALIQQRGGRPELLPSTACEGQPQASLLFVAVLCHRQCD